MLNTQEQAHLLKAARAMLAAAGPMRIEASGVQTTAPARFAVGRLSQARLVNGGQGALWRTVTVSGVPTSAPAAGGDGLSVTKRFYRLDGASADPASLQQGERIIVRIGGQPDARRKAMTVIDDALPAGFEIEAILRPADAQGSEDDDGNKRPGRFGFLGELSTPSAQEKRDDRFIAALTQEEGGPFAVAYIARAVTPGDFFMPGAEVRDMYRPSVNAHTAASRIRIAPAK
jgi:uncharacterized protein YfaS (alpha-2-macroglobulin family)